MINLATIQSNSINYMQIELEYGSRNEYRQKDGYRILVEHPPPSEDNSNVNTALVGHGLHLKVAPFCTTDLIRHMPPKHPAVKGLSQSVHHNSGEDYGFASFLTLDGFIDELLASD